MTTMITIPRSAGGTWEFVQDTSTMVRFRQTGKLAWTYLKPDQARYVGSLYFK